MNRIYKITSFAIVLVFLFTGIAMAQGNTAIGVSIDGENVNYNDNFGYPFIDSNNRTLVPFRITLEKVGAIVSWNDDTKTAKAEKDGITVLITIGKNFIIANDKVIPIDTSAVIKDGRTYLPIRAVLESFGYTINWNNNTNTVEAVLDIEDYNNYINNVIYKFNKFGDDYLNYDDIIHINEYNSKIDQLDKSICLIEVEKNRIGIQFSVSDTGSINQILVIHKEENPSLSDYGPIIIPAIYVTNPSFTNDEIIDLLVELIDNKAMEEYGNIVYNSVQYGGFQYEFQILLDLNGYVEGYFFSASSIDDIGGYNYYNYYEASDKFEDLFGWGKSIAINSSDQQELEALLTTEEFIKNNSIYSTQLNDGEGNLFDVYLLPDEAEERFITNSSDIWAGASIGEVIYDGKFKIASVIYENGKPRIQLVDFQYNYGNKLLNENIQINMSRGKVYTINNENNNNPDILCIGIIQGSSDTSTSSYYIKEGLLNRIETLWSTTPIVQIDANQFYTLKYIGQLSDHLWDKIILELNINENKFNEMSTEAVTDNIENYESYKLHKLY